MTVNLCPVVLPIQYPWSAHVLLVILSSPVLTLKHPSVKRLPLQFLSLPTRILARLDFPTPVAPRMTILGLGNLSSLLQIGSCPAPETETEIKQVIFPGFDRYVVSRQAESQFQWWLIILHADSTIKHWRKEGRYLYDFPKIWAKKYTSHGQVNIDTQDAWHKYDIEKGGKQ